MKVFVDTSVWINYLKGYKTNKTRYLKELIESGQSIYSLPVVVQEILQGFRYDNDVSIYIDKLEALNFFSFDFQDAAEAAKQYRSLRKQGITATTIDLQIVSICLRYQLALLTEDSDFSSIGKKLNLLLV